jgi:hypothetical protein
MEPGLSRAIDGATAARCTLQSAIGRNGTSVSLQMESIRTQRRDEFARI